MGGGSAVPMSIPGRIDGVDFVNFIIPDGFPQGYNVLVPTLIGSPTFSKTLGPLAPRHILPNAQYDPYGSIFLINPNPNLPTFTAPMSRGGTYTIPPVRRQARMGQPPISMYWSR